MSYTFTCFVIYVTRWYVSSHWFVHLFISGMRHWACIASVSRADSSEPHHLLHSGRGYWIPGLAGIVFIHLRGHPGGLLQFSKRKQLRSCHLFHLAFGQSGQTGRNAMLGQYWKVWLPSCPSHVIILHWSTASILSTSLLVTAQYSEPYRKMGRMQVLYNFSLVEMEILDFKIWASRFCTAAQVMVL